MKWPCVGYTYEADHHCPTCAEERFGPKVHDDITPPVDREGNEVGAVLSTSEFFESVHCGDCGELILEV